jgi:hypothetical protein
MRATQYVGLTDKATKFLKEFRIEPCQYCGYAILDIKTEIGLVPELFSDTYPIYRHSLKDNGYAIEFLQACPWSVGPMLTPMLFIGLRVFNQNDQQVGSYLWVKDESVKADEFNRERGIFWVNESSNCP